MDSRRPPNFRKYHSGQVTTRELIADWKTIKGTFLEPENGLSRTRKILSLIKGREISFKLHYNVEQDLSGDIVAEYNPTPFEPKEFETILENVDFEEYKTMVKKLNEGYCPEEDPLEYIENQ